MPTRNPHPFAHLTEGRLTNALHARAHRLVHTDHDRRRLTTENTLPRAVLAASRSTTPSPAPTPMPTPTPVIAEGAKAPSPAAPSSPSTTPTTGKTRVAESVREALHRRRVRMGESAPLEHNGEPDEPIPPVQPDPPAP